MLFSRACKELGLYVNANPTAIWTEPKNGRAACFYATPCKRGCSIDAAFQTPTGFISPAISTGNLDLITEALVYKIETDKNGIANKVHYIDKTNNQRNFAEANYIVLAASAMESCRILLNSKSELFPNGLANSSELIGRNITDSPASGWDIQIPALENLAPHNEDGTSEPHVCLSWWIRGKEERLKNNVDFFGGYRIIPYGGGRKNPPSIGTFDPYLSIKRGIFGSELKQHLRRYYGSIVHLSSIGAMQPNSSCYCEIDQSLKDYWGIPALKFHWNWSDEDLNRAAHAYGTVKKIVTKMGARIINDEAPPDGRSVFSTGGGNNHEIGGAIMGDNKKNLSLVVTCKHGMSPTCISRMEPVLSIMPRRIRL
jgi:choline dehydrogenase-like flavoprotein